MQGCLGIYNIYISTLIELITNSSIISRVLQEDINF